MCSYTFVLQYDWEMQYYSWSALIVHVCWIVYNGEAEYDSTAKVWNSWSFRPTQAYGQ
jgi:hypothetical protein